MQDLMDFNAPTTTITVGQNTATTQLNGSGNNVTVYNPNTFIVYAKLGGASITAATTDTQVPPGYWSWKKSPEQTHMATMSNNASNTGNLIVQHGNGK